MTQPFGRIGMITVSSLSFVLLSASWFKWAPIDFTEACGFVTGAACVWLVTRGNIWNWPIGLANNLFFAVLFWRARLFADMGLQGVYLILAAREANRPVICDTNAFATTLWHRRYMGFPSPELDEFATHCRADLYILTGDEIPFVQDGLRDGETIRHEMQGWFEVALRRQPCPWILVRGEPACRLKQAVFACCRIPENGGVGLRAKE